ncbi:hypothetical protein PAPYR_2211 [Paratrimastix pyriformis]|uniref:Transmembrane protein n=1 Tax=Paratrimastix pyriformis TaxID=342808 RepID=A0ABQ8US76_9EUKA|nr:hypothetical protein PAPYR_2211 [Paratrimastix pyriformis]
MRSRVSREDIYALIFEICFATGCWFFRNLHFFNYWPGETEPSYVEAFLLLLSCSLLPGNVPQYATQFLFVNSRHHVPPKYISMAQNALGFLSAFLSPVLVASLVLGNFFANVLADVAQELVLFLPAPQDEGMFPQERPPPGPAPARPPQPPPPEPEHLPPPPPPTSPRDSTPASSPATSAEPGVASSPPEAPTASSSAPSDAAPSDSLPLASIPFPSPPLSTDLMSGSLPPLEDVPPRDLPQPPQRPPPQPPQGGPDPGDEDDADADDGGSDRIAPYHDEGDDTDGSYEGEEDYYPEEDEMGGYPPDYLRVQIGTWTFTLTAQVISLLASIACFCIGLAVLHWGYLFLLSLPLATLAMSIYISICRWYDEAWMMHGPVQVLLLLIQIIARLLLRAVAFLEARHAPALQYVLLPNPGPSLSSRAYRLIVGKILLGWK